ncbi:hypothetical protein [Bythopirellula goksoeyrii]|uniref:Uncharacterized protein n=1 Tax=Bythopirellula goksoeyrii TaxID=1400387 RepID=A0A5B9QFC9_9BACT|nr:hypothetical protein [Bythopirellula goksoeyrii]QEG36252.1 hypothetical protein Pr1d_35640 [Bythopirellula goksoeyrii]
MKQNRTMDEALTAAKELRKNLVTTSSSPQPESDSHLKVIDSKRNSEYPHREESDPDLETISSAKSEQSTEFVASTKPVWVRHTIGLRDTTSLRLRDAADGQKRKERHGQLGVGEPANEQEIADLGITLALKQLGYDP